MTSTQLMAIINATPDSYFSASRVLLDSLSERVQKLEQEGADIFDIGGESTRPGAEEVSLNDELRRVLPVIECVRSMSQKPISIDTMKPEVAEEAIQKGVTLINDISGLRDNRMIQLLQRYEHVECVIMHMLETPKTMQNNPTYENGVVQSVYDFFSYKLDELRQKGISPGRIILDPGIGFGKTLQDNLLLMRNVSYFKKIGCRLLYGVSRKLWIRDLLHRTVEERLPGTLAAALFLAQEGVDILRVHDVEAHKDVLKTASILHMIGE